MRNEITIQRLGRRLRELERTAATKQDVASLAETIEITTNPDTLWRISESLDDIAHGREKRVQSVKEMQNEF